MLQNHHFTRKINFNHLPKKILLFLGFFVALNVLFVIQNLIIHRHLFGSMHSAWLTLPISFALFLLFTTFVVFCAKLWKKYHTIYLTDKICLHDVVLFWTKEIKRFKLLMTLFFLFVLASVFKFAQIEIIYYQSCVNNLILWNRNLQLTWMVLFGAILVLALGFSSFFFYQINQSTKTFAKIANCDHWNWVQKHQTKLWKKITNCYLTTICKLSDILKAYWRKFFVDILFSLSNFRRHYFVTMISASSYLSIPTF